MFNKKAIISLNLFVLLLIVFFILLGFTYFYKDFAVQNSKQYISKTEIFNTGLSLRSFFIQAVIYENQTIIYQDIYDSDNIFATLNNSSITLSKQTEDEFVIKKFHLYGIQFCSEYNISTKSENSFSYNGSCIAKT